MNWRRLRRRFRRGFPLAFLILAVMALAGGVLHAPSNYDGLAYRTPRVLHWLAADQWHWIHTEFQRLNTRGTAFEWMNAPMIALMKTDRFLFLINAISFLLLPGLIFGVFRGLGVRHKVAWHWMWILPTGYCYLLQASSIGNDLFGAVFPLAAIYFALRAARSHAIRDVRLSVLAAALMTASKTSNLPLLLPWLIVIAPGLKAIRSNIAGTLAIVLMAAGASFLPLAWANYQSCGDWTGAAAERLAGRTPVSVLRVANNTFLLAIQNLAPPIFPFAKTWNRAVAAHTPQALKKKLEGEFEPAGAHWELDEMQVEEAAGLGFGVSVLALVTLTAGIVRGRGSVIAKPPRENSAGISKWVLFGALIALCVCVVKMGLGGIGRIVAPYYALLIPGLLLAGGAERCIRTRWWRAMVLVIFIVAGLLLIISPARPLWPVNRILSRSDSKSSLVARARSVYSVYAQRADAFAAARKLLPPDATVIGMVTFDDPETSFWRPFFSRRIKHVTAADSREFLLSEGIRYVFVNKEKLPGLFHRSVDEWIAAMHGTVADRIILRLRAGSEPSEWLLVRLDAEPSGATGAPDRP